MAKNITIREGDTSKQFTAKKLKMNLVGGGTTNFVPEDEVLDYVDLKDHTFTAAGTFLPSQFNCDGFRQVKIDIPADVKEKTITANGEYNAADDNVAGYSKVTVAVPGGGGGGPFTVRFFDIDRETILKTDMAVPYGGTATCNLLDGTTRNGQYFIGWNPSPVGVTENMNCYPIYQDYIIDPQEIQDSWETICMDGGEHYPLGSYKSLILDADGTFLDYNGVERTQGFQTNFHMVKVSAGESGNKSTWMSTGCLYLKSGGFIGSDTYNGRFSEGGTLKRGWTRSDIRHFLNQTVLANMPYSLLENIKDTTKYSRDFTTDAVDTILDNIVTIDKIWLPSMHECTTAMRNGSGYVIPWDCVSNIDYTSIYVPTYHYGNNYLPFRDWYSGQDLYRIDLGFDWQSDPNVYNMYEYWCMIPFCFCL